MRERAAEFLPQSFCFMKHGFSAAFVSVFISYPKHIKVQTTPILFLFLQYHISIDTVFYKINFQSLSSGSVFVCLPSCLLLQVPESIHASIIMIFQWIGINILLTICETHIVQLLYNYFDYDYLFRSLTTYPCLLHKSHSCPTIPLLFLYSDSRHFCTKY